MVVDEPEAVVGVAQDVARQSDRDQHIRPATHLQESDGERLLEHCVPPRRRRNVDRIHPSWSRARSASTRSRTIIREPPSTNGTKVLASRTLTRCSYEQRPRSDTPRSPVSLRAQLRHLSLELLDAPCLRRELPEQERHHTCVRPVHARLNIEHGKEQSSDGPLERDHDSAGEPPMRRDRDGREIARPMKMARISGQPLLDVERGRVLEMRRRRYSGRLAQARRDQPRLSTPVRGRRDVDSLPSHSPQSSWRAQRRLRPPALLPWRPRCSRETTPAGPARTLLARCRICARAKPGQIARDLKKVRPAPR
jgi:hypothetical protein